MASEYPNIDVRTVDIMQAVGRVIDYRVFTTPFIVIEGKLDVIGVPREAELRARLARLLE